MKAEDGIGASLTPIIQAFLTNHFTLEQVARISAMAFKVGKQVGKIEEQHRCNKKE